MSHTDHTFKTHFEELFKKIKEANADGEFTFQEALGVAGEVLDLFAHLCKQINVEELDVTWAKAFILGLYDQWVAPLDITGRPWLEGLVDSYVRKAISDGIDLLIDKYLN